jgi:hypothetical protein
MTGYLRASFEFRSGHLVLPPSEVSACPGLKCKTPVYEGELSQGLCYLPSKAEHFFLANLINERFEYERALPDLYEPVLVVLGHRP